MCFHECVLLNTFYHAGSNWVLIQLDYTCSKKGKVFFLFFCLVSFVYMADHCHILFLPNICINLTCYFCLQYPTRRGILLVSSKIYRKNPEQKTRAQLR